MATKREFPFDGKSRTSSGLAESDGKDAVTSGADIDRDVFFRVDRRVDLLSGTD